MLLSPMLYNPFEQVTKSSFRELVESGYADFVLQRFEWPDVKEKTGFLLTPYDDEQAADQHAHQLGSKEGRALQCPLPKKLVQVKVENLGMKLLILKGRKSDEKIKVYRGTERLCDHTFRDRYTCGRSLQKNGHQRSYVLQLEEEIRWLGGIGAA